MGKIYKALEKSITEKQNVQKNKTGTFFTQPNNRQQPIDLENKEQVRLEKTTKDDRKLDAIHALLDDKALNSYERQDRSNQETIKDAVRSLPGDRRNSLVEKKDEIRLKSESDDTKVQKNTYVKPQAVSDRDGDMHHKGAIVELTGVEPQGLAAKNLSSAGGVVEPRSEIQYFRYEDKPSTSDKDEPPHFQQTPESSSKLHYSLVTLSKPKSFEAEQFKILRANLLFPKSGKPPRTILITSSIPGEGKTFTAINLAVSLAQNLNSHVLLVDADIRKPEVHLRFGFNENVEGLSDFLTQNKPLSSFLLKTQLSNLTLLPGGKAVMNPSELISSEKMKELLTELSRRYNDRYVIIDAAPPKFASETCALARFVERIIPVVKSGWSNRRLVEETINLLERDKIQGIVLNCYDIRGKSRYGYHKYNEYYSK